MPGIGTAIIVIRGMDLFSREIIGAATNARMAIDSLEKRSITYSKQASDLGKKASTFSAKALTLESEKVAKLAAVSKYEVEAASKTALAKTARARASGLIGAATKLETQATEKLTKAASLANYGSTEAAEKLRTEAAALQATAAAKRIAAGESRKLSDTLKLEAKDAANLADINKKEAEELSRGATRARDKSLTLTGRADEKNIAAAEAQAEADRLRKATRVLQVQSGIKKAAGALSSTGLVSTALLTLPIAAIGTASVKSAVQFNKSMRNIQSISRETDGQTQRLAKSFLDISRDINKTVASPYELAEAYYEIQSAAFYGAEAQKILAQSTKTATAGLADQTETAKAVAMALHAYGVGAEEVGHFTDVMMRSVDIGVFRFEDLTRQMGDFIAAAGMMKMPIEQVFAALTTMTKKGLPVDEAATSLNRLMTSFLKPSEKAKDAAAEFGIELSAEHLKAMGFAGAMNEVIAKTGGAEGALAAIFPEMRSMRGIFALGSDGLKMFNNDVKTLEQSAGAVNKVFGVQIQSWDSQLKNFKNTVSVLGITIGSELMPIILNFLDNSVKPAIQGFQDLSEAQQEFRIGVLAFVAALGPGMIVLSAMLNVVNALIGGLVKLAAIMPILKVAAGSIAGAAAVPAAVGAGGVALAYGVSKATNTRNLNQSKMSEAELQKAKALQDEIVQLRYAEAKALELNQTGLAAEYTARIKALQAQYDQLVGYERLVEAQELARKSLDGVSSAYNDVGVKVLEVNSSLEGTRPTLDKITGAWYDVAGAIGSAAVEAAKIKGFMDPMEAMAIAYGNSQWAKDAEAAKREAKLIAGGAKGPADYRKATTAPLHGSIWSGLPNMAMTAGEADVERSRREAEARQAWKDAVAESANNWKSAMETAAGMFTDKLNKGMEFSIGLGDLTGGANGGGPLAPGANGAFEDIYRIQDIAMSATRGKGVDTDKWMQMYGLDPAAAQEIVKKFQMGIFDADVLKYIDQDKLIDMAKLEQAAEASQKALAENLAGKSGIAKDVFSSLLGIGKDKEGNTVIPNINAGAIQTGVKDQIDALPKDATVLKSIMGIDTESANNAANSAITVLLPAFDSSLTDNEEQIAQRGAAYWGIVEGGIIDAAKKSGALYNAVEAMVFAALGGGNTSTGTGSGVQK